MWKCFFVEWKRLQYLWRLSETVERGQRVDNLSAADRNIATSQFSSSSTKQLSIQNNQFTIVNCQLSPAQLSIHNCQITIHSVPATTIHFKIQNSQFIIHNCQLQNCQLQLQLIVRVQRFKNFPNHPKFTFFSNFFLGTFYNFFIF